jgi:hypothetical protein
MLNLGRPVSASAQIPGRGGIGIASALPDGEIALAGVAIFITH